MHADEQAIRGLIAEWMSATAAGRAGPAARPDGRGRRLPHPGPAADAGQGPVRGGPRGRPRAGPHRRDLRGAGGAGRGRTRVLLELPRRDGDAAPGRRARAPERLAHRRSCGSCPTAGGSSPGTRTCSRPSPRGGAWGRRSPPSAWRTSRGPSSWYRDVLGFAADPFGPPADPSFAILRRDGAELMLQKIRGMSGSPVPRRGRAGAGTPTSGSLTSAAFGRRSGRTCPTSGRSWRGSTGARSSR